MQHSDSRDKSRSKSKQNASHLEESMRTKAIKFIQNNMSSNYKKADTWDENLIALVNMK